MNLKDAVQFLLQNGYLAQVKGKYRVTAKFNQEMTGIATGLVLTGSVPQVVEKPLPSLRNNADWVQLYINFIREAEVPVRGEGKDGGYDLNKYSEKAMKMFRRMIEKEGVIYGVLVKSTLLYYKTHRKFPHTITRYISEGSWRSDYQALLQSAKDGTLENHIQTEIDHEKEFSKYRLG